MKFFILFLATLIVFTQTATANTYLTENSSWSNGLTGLQWTSVVAGDITGDGLPDLVQIGCTGSIATACQGYSVKVYTNNGISFVENSTWQSNLTAVHYGSLALGDIDNDGDLDLALSGCYNGGGTVSGCPNSNDFFSTIYVNNGTSFVESSTWKGDILNAWKSSFAFGDINLDGKLDLVFSGNSIDRFSRVYINNGSSFKEDSFWGQSLIGMLGSSTTLIDIDNDGDLDLGLVGDSSQGYVSKIYVNNGTSFVENSTWQSNLLGVELASSSWGDFDNNGRMDLTITGHTSNDEHSIYNNTGTALLEINKRDPFGTLRGIYEATQSLGDYNNDGKLEIFAAGRERYSTIYRNTSSSDLDDPEPGVFNTKIGSSGIWLDVNNDSTLDLVLIGYDDLTNWFKAAIYTNNITTKNTAPSAPATLIANYSNGILNLSWGMGSDTETPALGLYYNLRVGTSSGGHQIVTGVYGGGDDNGYFGNMMQRRNILLNLPNLSGTLYWSVQTIDTGLKAGAWAPERTLNVSSGAQNQSQTNETTAPNLTIVLPVNNTIFTIANVSIAANYSDASNVTCTSRLNTTSYVNMSLNGAKNGTASHNYTSLANGTYTAFVNCTDIYSNSIIRNVVFRINVSTPVSAPSPDSGSGSGSSGGSGGGGGGGGGAGAPASNSSGGTKINTTVPVSTVKEQVEVKSGEVNTIEVRDPVLKEITLEVHETVGSVKVEATKVEQPVVPIVPAGNVYSYVEINPVNVSGINIKNASITFDVEKNWLIEQNINRSTVKLNRYNNGIWQQLSTILVSENSTTITYKAITPGFSLFAITGEKNIVSAAPAMNNDYYLPATIGVIAVAIVGGLWYYKKPKKKASVAVSAYKLVLLSWHLDYQQPAL